MKDNRQIKFDSNFNYLGVYKNHDSAFDYISFSRTRINNLLKRYNTKMDSYVENLPTQVNNTLDNTYSILAGMSEEITNLNILELGLADTDRFELSQKCFTTAMRILRYIYDLTQASPHKEYLSDCDMRLAILMLRLDLLDDARETLKNLYRITDELNAMIDMGDFEDEEEE